MPERFRLPRVCRARRIKAQGLGWPFRRLPDRELLLRDRQRSQGFHEEHFDIEALASSQSGQERKGDEKQAPSHGTPPVWPGRRGAPLPFGCAAPAFPWGGGSAGAAPP